MSKYQLCIPVTQKCGPARWREACFSWNYDQPHVLFNFCPNQSRPYSKASDPEKTKVLAQEDMIESLPLGFSGIGKRPLIYTRPPLEKGRKLSRIQRVTYLWLRWHHPDLSRSRGSPFPQRSRSPSPNQQHQSCDVSCSEKSNLEGRTSNLTTLAASTQEIALSH